MATEVVQQDPASVAHNRDGSVVMSPLRLVPPTSQRRDINAGTSAAYASGLTTRAPDVPNPEVLALMRRGSRTVPHLHPRGTLPYVATWISFVVDEDTLSATFGRNLKSPV